MLFFSFHILPSLKGKQAWSRLKTTQILSFFLNRTRKYDIGDVSRISVRKELSILYEYGSGIDMLGNCVDPAIRYR